MEFFTNTYGLSLSTHADKPEKKRPVYEFRAATLKERRKETELSKWLIEITNNPGEDVEDPLDFVEPVLDAIKKRLLFVRVGNKRKASMMDLEETLDYTSVMELYMSMRLQEEIRIADKKKSSSLLSLSTGEFAKPVAEVATVPQDKKAKSSKSNAPDATATDATNAAE